METEKRENIFNLYLSILNSIVKSYGVLFYFFLILYFNVLVFKKRFRA